MLRNVREKKLMESVVRCFLVFNEKKHQLMNISLSQLRVMAVSFQIINLFTPKAAPTIRFDPAHNAMQS